MGSISGDKVVRHLRVRRFVRGVSGGYRQIVLPQIASLL
jgi:hypothetical protein